MPAVWSDCEEKPWVEYNESIIDFFHISNSNTSAQTQQSERLVLIGSGSRFWAGIHSTHNEKVFRKNDSVVIHAGNNLCSECTIIYTFYMSSVTGCWALLVTRRYDETSFVPQGSVYWEKSPWSEIHAVKSHQNFYFTHHEEFNFDIILFLLRERILCKYIETTDAMFR